MHCGIIHGLIGGRRPGAGDIVLIPPTNDVRVALAGKSLPALLLLLLALAADVLHPESKQQTTPASPRDALECVAALARTRECRQDCVRFAYRGPQVDRLHVLELKRDVE